MFSSLMRPSILKRSVRIISSAPRISSAWKEYSIDNIIVKGGSGGTPNTSITDYYNGSIPFLSITDITNSNGFIYDTEKHISEEALNSSAAWIVPKESISLAMYASVGKVAILKRDSALYVLVCEYCGNEFVAYGNPKKRFCSRECQTLAGRAGE